MTFNSTNADFTLTPLILEVNSPNFDQTLVSGQDLTMLISVVSDSPLSYQWQFDDQDLAGQTNSVLMLDSVTSAQMGQYRMVVSTVCNGATNLWYGPEATVSIIVPLSLALQTVVTSTNILEQFNISGTAGQQFVLQSSTDLQRWQTVSTKCTTGKWNNGFAIDCHQHSNRRIL